MGAWLACGTNGPSAHPERGRPVCGQPEVGSARPVQQPGMAAKQIRSDETYDTAKCDNQERPRVESIDKLMLAFLVETDKLFILRT